VNEFLRSMWDQKSCYCWECRIFYGNADVYL